MKIKKLVLAGIFITLTGILGVCAREKAVLEGDASMTVENFTGDEVLFSFSYDGKNSGEFLKDWKQDQKTEKHEGYKLYTTTWSDVDTGLKVIVETKKFEKEKVIEWVARLENTGQETTPVIEDFKIADIDVGSFEQDSDSLILSYSKGSDVRDDDFLFVEKELNRLSTVTLSSTGGRSTSGDCMPYFNLHTDSGGYILAIGWSGQWKATFKRSFFNQVTVSAGMESTHFVLYPGESIRTPSFAMLKWSGEEEESYNAWRSYMISQHTPKDENGDVITLPITCGAWGGDSATQHLSTMKAISENGLEYDAYWVDAGWFGTNDRHSSDQYGDEWFKNAGDWFHNVTLYPDGISPVSDAAHEAGYDFLLWFEPERAWNDTWIVEEHGEWFLKGTAESTSYIFDMGNETARKWMTNFISGKIEAYGVDIYRQDFNIDPLPYWKSADTTERQGITEMKYIEGLYAYLDALLEKNPGLILDNCAGGGRRLDYEMLSRALPFWRSDYQCFTTYETTPCQVQTDGLSRWVPLSGTGVQSRPADTYSFRSNLAYAMQCPPAMDDLTWQKQMFEDFHKAQPYFLGDYYCLTDGDITDNSVWYAYQMHREDLGEGFILVFRRENAEESVMELALYTPHEGAKFELTDADTGKTWTEVFSAAEGNRSRLTVNIDSTRETKLIFYKIID